MQIDVIEIENHGDTYPRKKHLLYAASIWNLGDRVVYKNNNELVFERDYFSYRGNRLNEILSFVENYPERDLHPARHRDWLLGLEEGINRAAADFKTVTKKPEVKQEEVKQAEVKQAEAAPDVAPKPKKSRKEYQREYQREYYRKRYHNDPEYRAKVYKRKRDRIKSTLERLENYKAYQREYYHKKKRENAIRKESENAN